jgi:hypothetical protein
MAAMPSGCLPIPEESAVETRAKPSEATSAFQRSRIYAEGWNAARALNSGAKPVSNPYASEPERSRWNEGFTQALGKS